MGAFWLNILSYELLSLKAFFIDTGSSSMDLISDWISSMMIILLLKSKIIPNSLRVFVPKMRSNAGLLLLLLSYSITSGVIVTTFKLLYSNNFS